MTTYINIGMYLAVNESAKKVPTVNHGKNKINRGHFRLLGCCRPIFGHAPYVLEDLNVLLSSALVNSGIMFGIAKIFCEKKKV